MIEFLEKEHIYLKDGMIITYRNGNKRFLMGGELFEKEDGSCCDLSTVTTDLYNKKGIENLDFVKVEYMGETLWEREKEMQKNRLFFMFRPVLLHLIRDFGHLHYTIL